MHTKIIRINKAKAEKFLAKMALNRSLSQLTVDRYARDMASDNFPLTGEPIIIDKNGFLLDGQHRMAAVVQADVELPFLVVFGAEPESIHNINTGKPRSVFQVLQIRGVKNAQRMASVARCLDYAINGAVARTLSVDEVADLLSKHKGIGWIVDVAFSSGPSAFNTAPVLAGFAIVYGKHQAFACEAWDAFASGADLKRGDPLLTLRNYVSSSIGLRTGRSDRLQLTRRVLTALAYRLRGEQLHKSQDGMDGLRTFCGPRVVKAAEAAA